ncbi:autotransporter outer membrane beta-barrel domain-containing protein [Pseudomonas sp. P7759]|uniref:autotransporter outer membrane beta-barrel domain-containing protein n=1 Tax=Pseudomonas sp. P7759 TaxID=2738831 RepID=UPI0015A455F0|nr:autotransporter outer membrane beta-barrel domain-containing protein [Pseudomonas sp. P7759]NWC74245.1 autotransporter outer membrane beta-barrel domain-containing protein [Pseudomonas sp. P7759]
MHTLHPKRPAILTLSPLALAMFMLQPTLAQAFTPTVTNGAVVDGETVTGGQQSIGTNGTANNTLIEVTGTQAVFQHGVSNDATVDGRQLVQSGTSNRTVVNVGGSQVVSAGGIANGTVLNGGTQTVQTPNSRANGTVINAGGVQTLTLGGAAADTVINDGGVQTVINQGTALNTFVLTGGVQNLERGILGGAVATDTHISGGVQNVYDSATANNSTVSNGGQVNLFGGAQANGLVADAGGSVNVMENGVKTVDSLTLNGGRLAFAPSTDGIFKTFTVNALSGSGSILMNTDIANAQNDVLVVEGAGLASGNHTLIVADSGHEPGTTDGRLLLVDTHGGSAKFDLYGGHVDAGAFRYGLQQDGDDWVLASTGKGPSGPSPQNLSSGANAAIAAHTASASLWSAQMNALVKRLGELRMGEDNGGVWTRAISKRFDVGEHSSRAYSQNISGLEIGADKAVALSNGKVYLGAMVGTARSDQDFGEGASGNTDSKMFGVYATYLHDNGIYVDSVLKYSRFDNDIKMPTNLGDRVKGSYKTNGVGADIEVGKHIPLGGGWFVEPQLELTATRTQGADYTASNGLRVKSDDLDSLQSRVGSLFGRSLALSNGMKAQPYVKASYVTEHAGSSKVSVNGNKLDAKLPGDRVELGFGGVLQVSEKSKISLDAEYAKGNSIEQPWGVNLGYRYLW